MSSPLAGMLDTMFKEMSAANEYAMFISPEQRARVLQGIAASYYGPEYTAEVILDTNRAWCARMPLLHTLFPQSRVVACVRNVSWIADSIERLVQKNALSPSARPLPAPLAPRFRARVSRPENGCRVPAWAMSTRSRTVWT